MSEYFDEKPTSIDYWMFGILACFMLTLIVILIWLVGTWLLYG